METEFAIIGGGVVGLSIAYGLLKKGRRVTVFDEGDGAFRASVGNFGLIWVQGKGANKPEYAQWTRHSAKSYPMFAEELSCLTGQELALVQEGGYFMHTSESVLNERIDRYSALKAQLGGDYPYDVIDHQALKKEEPHIGPKVAGAIYHHEDGHINPLWLLRALATATQQLSGTLVSGCKIVDMAPHESGYKLTDAEGRHYTAEKVILAAGLGSIELSSKLGFKTHIRPQQGQVLITEKIPKLVHRPNAVVRQVNEGGVQIGASKAEVGFDNKEDQKTVSALAQHAIELFPELSKVKLVRSWAALRIMSPDGLPIYQESPEYKDVFFVTCHSGITLASAHAELLTDWLLKKPIKFDLTPFSEARFNV